MTKEKKKISTKTLMGLVIFAIVVLAFVSRLLTLYIFDLMILSLAVMGVVEIARAFERDHKFSNIVCAATFPATLYIFFMVLLKNQLTWEFYLIVLLGIIVFYFLLVWCITIIWKKHSLKEIENNVFDGGLVKYATEKAINTLVLLVYPTLVFFTLILLNRMGELPFVQKLLPENGSLVTFALILVFVVAMSTDTAAQVCGKKFQGKKLCPTISPNKTYSGAIGGLLFGLIDGMLLFLIYQANDPFVAQFSIIGGAWWHILLICMFASVLGQCGDILASYIKRRARIKDYSTIIPGHGGIMDRVDGIIFNSLVIFIAFALII